MNIRWDHFVNQYDTTRYSGPDGRDTRHIQFVREFASVVSVLQVCFFRFAIFVVVNLMFSFFFVGQNEQCDRLV